MEQDDLEISNRPKINKCERNNNKYKSIITEVFYEYLNNSTLHGISYLRPTNSNWIEKAWWIIGIIFNVTICTILVQQTWTKWKNNPVIISFAEEHTSVWEIPFPAVTVCPFVKIKLDKFNYTAIYNLFNKNYTDFNTSMSTENVTKFWDLSLICGTYPIHEDKENYRTTKVSIFDNIKMVAPSLTDILGNRIIWQNKYKMAKEVFAEQLTTEGLCFTSNTLSHSNMYTQKMSDTHIIEHLNESKIDTEWSTEKGYSESDKGSSYPLRTAQAGLDYGLKIYLSDRSNKDFDYCGESVIGFKMILHNPAENPRVSGNYFLIPINQKLVVAVTPKVIRTSKDLLGYPLHSRNCYFEHERKLQFFKIYTQYNCEIECLANITLEYCGCVPFYLPRENKTQICGYGNIGCLLLANDLQFKFSNKLRNKKQYINEFVREEFQIFLKCRCLASCDHLEYKVEISSADNIDSSKIVNEQVALSPINIFFKSSEFLALERSELYGSADFIANAGGILGLFIGFSFLSFLEIIYFLTLRVWCKIYHKNKIDLANEKSKSAWND